MEFKYINNNNNTRKAQITLGHFKYLCKTLTLTENIR